MKHPLAVAALFAILLAGLTGCSSTPDDAAVQQNDAPMAYPFTRLSPSAPPPKPFETKYEPSEPMKEVWRDGFWDYDGTEFTWVPGHYIMRPHPTAAWSPDRWERRAYGWAFISGHWE